MNELITLTLQKTVETDCYVGYVHPFKGIERWFEKTKTLKWEEVPIETQSATHSPIVSIKVTETRKVFEEKGLLQFSENT